MSTAVVEVYIEAGKKRTFAGAIDWPGWCRVGKNEASALQSLFDYRQRYADALRGSGVPFTVVARLADLKVIERLTGGSGTDYGAPEAHPASDERKMDDADLKRGEKLLKACWAAFDAVVSSARGRSLRLGPHGGGRTLQKIVDHVVEAEVAYVQRLGWWTSSGQSLPPTRGAKLVREAALLGVRASAAGKIPGLGSRGGRRWSPRYFVRRAAWHILDHAWEIEDRLE